MQIITRKDAMASSLIRYYTGNPCKHGHLSERLVSTRACCKCTYLAVQKYNKENVKKIVMCVKKWRIENKAHYIKKSKEYDSTPNRAIRNRIASAIRRSLKKSKSGRKWESLVGYTLADLKLHLEKQFIGLMSWENMGLWHIDHITPLSNFEQTNQDEFKQCWSLSNLRPIWADENQKKYNKIYYLI
jgi:hypothetical protein